MKFLRRDAKRFVRLGRKNKYSWRRPRGRDNKMREKRKGYPKSVSEGYKKKKKDRGKINGKVPVEVKNIKDLSKIKKENIAVLGRMGKKKKIEMARKGKDINWLNFNPKKILKEQERKEKEEKEKKKWNLIKRKN